MLRVEGLSKRYGTFEAVKDLSFRLEPGSIFGFVGPNGAGKTTAMKVIATLLKPNAGQLFIGDVDLVREPVKARRKIGYMPDFFGVYDNLKVSEYMEFYADCHEVPTVGRERLIGDLLELVHLGHKRDEYVDGLSRGMKQRLCLARCLVHDPDLLILDEPASGLDPRARIEMREILLELRRRGKTILISSHILAELSELCTHIGIIQDGRMVLSGPVGEVQRSVGARAIDVRVTGEPEAWVGAARSVTGVREVRLTEGGFRVLLDGEDEAVVHLLTSLIQAGIPVIHFAEAGAKLEDLFMAITGGEE